MTAMPVLPPSATDDWIRAMRRTAGVTPGSTRTLALVVEEHAARSPHVPALIGEDHALSYEQLAGMIRRVARWASANGIARGDRVALLMRNEPAFAAIWLGLSRIGIVTALVNTQLVGQGLAHCLAAADPSHLIVGATCLPALDTLPLDGMRLWTFGVDGPGADRLDRALDAFSDAPLTNEETAPVTLRDPALLIYTSGTTGLPKAARVSHHRVVMWSEWFAGIMDARPDDRLYDCLPMYHSIGGVVAIGAMLAAGGSTIVRRGFSARGFWDDVGASGATIFQYIGELCRYLVAAPPTEADRRHGLRLCCGNGLREEVWTAFAARFAIPRILEFYAATEGSFSLFNLEGKPGAIGRIPAFMAHRSPVALVRRDPDLDQPTRGSDGFCHRCEPDEPGEAIGLVSAGESRALATTFEGYTDPRDSERKLLRDVFAPGDVWFRTGDVMRRDRRGFFHFVDRVGDTFRWKGENVSTAEVAAALLACPGVLDATVYGVAVPGSDGRAGMAALAVDATFDAVRLADHLARRLPRYARPVFLRLTDEVALTGTFRPRKGDLVQQGFDPVACGEPLLVAGARGYEMLDEETLAEIEAGRTRL